jgi:hypothetical protein
MNMHSRATIHWVLFVIGLGVSPGAGATRVPTLPIKDLFQKTALIFIGTAKEAPEACRGVEPPCTGVAFTGVEVVAGKRDTAAELAFALPEGAFPDGTSLKVAGAPQFNSGERYLVFVRAGGWYLTPVTNWFHSVFREFAVGAPGSSAPASLFVDHDGRVVTGLDERGFQLGERIAPPAQLMRREQVTRGGAQSGMASSAPPTIDDKVKAALASGDAPAIARLGMPKDRLIEAIARYAQQIGLSQSEPIESKPRKSGRYDTQRRPEQSEAGLGKAAPELPLAKESTFGTKGHDLDIARQRPEKRQPLPSTPGNETIPGAVSGR